MIPVLSFKQFFTDVRRQKLRTLLTTFGIFWGTCSIVLLFAFGKGLREQQIKSQKGLGDNIAIFWPGITAKDYKGLPKGRPINFTEEDVALIKSKATTLASISVEFSKWNTNVQYKKVSTLRQIKGIWPEFGDMRNVIPTFGSRFINDLDMQEKRRVIFIGNGLAKDLFSGEGTSAGWDSREYFPAEEAVGRTLLLDGTPFTVIGVMEPKTQNSSYGGRDSHSAFIPASTFRTMYSRRTPNNFVAQARPNVSMPTARKEILSIMGAKYRFDPDDREALSVWDTTEGIAFLKSFFGAFQMFLVGIGIATLITGGIGVSNIMHVVLEERTKEIGVKMALGATKMTIMAQFVMETLLITAIGGVCGFFFASGIVAVIPYLKLEDYIGTPSIDMWAGVLAIVLLGIIGFFAGIFPARRAANLQPVQALKLF
ncbi:MAG: ABC transporter permease [Candidatus Zixiibacteriota bacterium]